MKILSIVLVIILFNSAEFSRADTAQSPSELKTGLSLNSVEYFWKEALEIYVTESEDYLETLTETAQELKNWRHKVLQDKFEIKIGELESILSKSNEEELSQLEGFVKSRGLDGLDDTLMMRLAQLHYDRAGFDFTAKMKKIKSIKNYGGPIPVPDYAKTISYSTEIIKKFPKSVLLDHAYYLLGYCLFDEGKDEMGSRVYEAMLRQFPNNALSYEARWRMAEFYFDNENYELAKKNYKELSVTPNVFQKKAIYKLGASDYADGNYNSAYNIFYQLFKENFSNRDASNPEEETLYNEAIDYLAYLRTKNVKMDLSEEEDSIVTERVADIYMKAQDLISAREEEIKFAERHPYSKKSPAFLSRAIESYEYEGNSVKAQRIREKFLTNYAPDSEFIKRNKNDVLAMVEVEDLYESILLSSASFHAEQAKHWKKSENYEAAIQYYMKFIDHFPSSPLRNQAKYEMAELQYFSGKYNDAGATYMNMALDTENDEYRQEAAYGYFLSEVKRIGYNLQGSEALKPDYDSEGNLKPESSLTPQEVNFQLAADFYLKNVNKGSRRQKILYKKAEIYFKHNNFKKTRENLNIIFRDTELSVIVSKAFNLLSETYNLENNWEKVVETKKRSIELAQRQKLEVVDSEILFKAKSPILLGAWKTEKRGEKASAAEQYEYYCITYPRSEEAPFSLLKSGTLYREVGDINSSNRVLARLVKGYSGSEYVANAKFLIAANSEALLDFEGAAQKYEYLVKKYKRLNIGIQAKVSAAYLRKALGQEILAANHFLDYAKATQDGAAHFEAAELFKSAGDNKKASAIYDFFVTGKMGTSFAIQGNIEKAWISDRYSLAMAYCNQALNISRRSKVALSATANHSLVGCQYIQARQFKNEILSKPDVEFYQKWPLLSKAYDVILKTQDEKWIEYSIQDLRELNKALAKVEILEKYKAVQGALVKNTLDSKQLLLLPDQQPEADLFYVRWPVDSNVGRVAYDQKKWDILEKDVSNEIAVKPRGYLFVAKARARAEKNDWAGVRRALEECLERVKDPVCSAYETILNPQKKFNGELYEAEDEGVVRLAQAIQLTREGKYKLAMESFSAAVKADTQFIDVYKYASLYLYSLKRKELSQMVLNQGLNNTQNDERLLVQKGYLSLKFGDLEAAKNILDELQDLEKNSIRSIILASHYNFLDGRRGAAKSMLQLLAKSEQNNYLVDEALKTQTMWEQNETRLPAEEKP